ISQMQLDLLAQPSLKTDTVAVAHDQHPDHELRVNRRPANVAVKGRQFLMQISHDPRYFGIDPAQQMACWNAPFEIEQVKQLTLLAALPPHHDPPPPLNESSERESWHADNHEPFFNIIGQFQTFGSAKERRTTS